MKLKNLFILLLLTCFCLEKLPTFAVFQRYTYKKPKSYDSLKEKINKCDEFYPYNTRFNEVLPNPIIYLYGKNTNDDPILLMTFSSTIPVEWLNGEKSINLDSIVLKLKIPEQHGYYYKILKISANQIIQTVAYSTSSTLFSSLQGQANFPSQSGGASGSVTGKVEHTYNRSKAYDTDIPIITSSGVGSDTLTLMLKRGEEYPIPNGQIIVYMLVRAIRDEKNKIGDIINDHYHNITSDNYHNSINDYCHNNDDFYENDFRFKRDLICLINELSGCNYKDLDDFFNSVGIKLEKAEGFQYKKVNDFIQNSVFLKYKDKPELMEALYEAEINDSDIKKLVRNLSSYSSAPKSFIDKVSKPNYVDVNYKLSKNIIDFINTLPSTYDKDILNHKKAKNLKYLVSANQNEVKLISNANNIGYFNIISYDLYSDAYKLKILISAYNYAFGSICSTPSDDFDLSKYLIKNDKIDICKCRCLLRKYRSINALNNQIALPKDDFSKLELRNKALELIDNMFSNKNKQKANMDAVIKYLDIDNLISKVSNCKFRSWDELKADSYYRQKYFNAISLVDKIYKESIDEYKKETTANRNLIDLVKNNNNVDLYFDKTIVQNKKRSFFRFEKDYIDLWCPPLISRVVILPIGALLWPLQLPDSRLEYHLDPNQRLINTSKILEGSKFDKDNNNADEYIRDDDIFKTLTEPIIQIEPIFVTPTIHNPQQITK